MGTTPSKSNSRAHDLLNSSVVDDDDFDDEGCEKFILLGGKAGRTTFSDAVAELFSVDHHLSKTSKVKQTLDKIAFWLVFDVLTNISCDESCELLYKSLEKDQPDLVKVLKEWMMRLSSGGRGSMAILVNLWNSSEFFRKFYTEQIMRGQFWSRPNLELLIQKIEQGEELNALKYCSIPTTVKKKTIFSLGSRKICFEECPASKKEHVKFLNRMDYVETLLYFVDLSLFASNTDIFYCIFAQNHISEKLKDARIILLFIKPDIAKRKLEYGFQFSQFNGSNLKFIERVNRISNEYKEQEAVNFVLHQHLSFITCGRVEYHILNVIDSTEVESVLPYIINPNPTNFHFISPILNRNDLKERLFSRLVATQLTDITISLY